MAKFYLVQPREIDETAEQRLREEVTYAAR